MPRSPLTLDLDAVPFFFRFRDAIFGHGFVATVETIGRAMCVREGDEYAIVGVEPGGLAAQGPTRESAMQAFRQTYRAVLIDIAAGRGSFDAFHREVRAFVHETSPEVLADWAAAVAAVRALGDGTKDVAKVDADTPASVAVSYSTDLVPQQNVVDAQPAELIAA